MVSALYLRMRERVVQWRRGDTEDGFTTAEWVVILAIVVTAATVISTLIMSKYQHKAESVQP